MGDEEDYKNFLSIFYITWIVLIVWFVLTLAVLYFRQSGSPFRSEQARSNLRYIFFVFALWTAAFIVKVIFAIIGKSTAQTETNDISLKEAIFLIIINIVSDVVPLIPILEIKFIEIFKKSHSKTKGLPLFNSGIEQ